jgi:hypothetical protein
MTFGAGMAAVAANCSRIAGSRSRLSLLALGIACALSACDDDGGDPVSPGSETQTLTYYEDVLPIFERSCFGCHVDSGIGPFVLDDYETARRNAGAIAAAVEDRRMPPYLVTNDGTCGEFSSPSLTTEEIQTITGWVEAGAPEGIERDPVLPGIDHLSGALKLKTPEFTPTPGGTPLDENDDYRCFLLDAPEEVKFITGYNVVPGNQKIVHHVVVSVIDPEAPGRLPNGDTGTNQEVIDALDARDPDVLGWRCFGLAGEGVDVSSIPTVWAPGQGVVHYPDNAGIPITPNQKLVVQVHYNLEDPETHGSMDSTTLELELKDAEQIENIGIYLPHDPFLNSILSGEEPYTLMPGRESEPFTWNVTFADLGLDGVPAFKLWGVFPHMHELGRRYTVELDTGSGDKKCMTEVKEWDFHWQHLYFSTRPEVLTPDASVKVTCDYDTTKKTEPILPGWGTQNEMCFLGLFVTVPNAP